MHSPQRERCWSVQRNDPPRSALITTPSVAPRLNRSYASCSPSRHRVFSTNSPQDSCAANERLTEPVTCRGCDVPKRWADVTLIRPFPRVTPSSQRSASEAPTRNSATVVSSSSTTGSLDPLPLEYGEGFGMNVRFKTGSSEAAVLSPDHHDDEGSRQDRSYHRADHRGGGAGR